MFSDNSKTIWRNSFNSEVNFSKISDVLHYRFEDGKSPKVSCENCLVDSEIHPEIVLDKYGVCDICSIVSNKNQLIEYCHASFLVGWQESSPTHSSCPISFCSARMSTRYLPAIVRY